MPTKNPGKFDNALDEAIWTLSLDGGPDEQAGAASDGLWAGILRDGNSIAAALREQKSEFPNVSAEDIAYVASKAGVILTESDQGFVGVKYYANARDLELDWKKGARELESGGEFEENASKLKRAHQSEAVKPQFSAGDRVSDLDGKRPGEIVVVGDWDSELGFRRYKVQEDAGARIWHISTNMKRIGSDSRGRPQKHRPNTSIADRREAGIIEGLTKAEMDSMEIRIPTFDWKQVGGDMNPGAHGGTIAEADGQAIQLLKIQPVREYVGDGEAKEVGYPFWSKEGYYDLDDLSLTNESVQDAIESAGLGEHLLDMTPEQRALAIAVACLDWGYRAEEADAGWAEDVISGLIVEWASGDKAGYEHIADEDDEFRREVLELYEVLDGMDTVSFHEEEDDAIEAAKDLSERKPDADITVQQGGSEVWNSADEDDDGELTENRRRARHRPNLSPLDRNKIQRALSYVHYWEARERGDLRQGRAEAARTAIRTEGLNQAEADVLLRTLHVERAELKPNQHRRNAEWPRKIRWPKLFDHNVMDSLLDMAAESNDPSGRGRVPDDLRGELSFTDELIEAARDYESALKEALEEVVEKYPPEDGATAEELFDDDAPYLVLMVLMGHGVGIMDGSWDKHYAETKPVERLLKQRLGRFADDSGTGSIPQALDNAVFEAMGRAGYDTDDDGYVKKDEG